MKNNDFIYRGGRVGLSIITFVITSSILIPIPLIIIGFYLTFFRLAPFSYIFVISSLFSIFGIFYFGTSQNKNIYYIKNKTYVPDVIDYFSPLFFYILVILPIGSVIISYFSGRIAPKREIIAVSILLLSFSIVLFSYGFLFRKYVNNFLPIFEFGSFQKNHAIQLIVNYDDFINRKIDNPSLIIGQDFLIKIHEHPRNEDEKNTVLLINQNTTPNPSIVTVILNKELADGLRNNKFILKTELKSISEFTKLEIALWRD